MNLGAPDQSDVRMYQLWGINADIQHQKTQKTSNCTPVNSYALCHELKFQPSHET